VWNLWITLCCALWIAGVRPMISSAHNGIAVMLSRLEMYRSSVNMSPLSLSQPVLTAEGKVASGGMRAACGSSTRTFPQMNRPAALFPQQLPSLGDGYTFCEQANGVDGLV